MYNNNLYTFFCTNNTINIKKTLELFSEIDVLYEEGIFFNFAISKGNVDVCKALLNYFENKQFPVKSENYKEAKEKLIEILENITNEMELSSEMKEILLPYVDFEGSEHNDSFSDDDLKDQTEFTTFKKSHSANDLNNSTFDNSKEILLTEENLKRLSNDSSGEKFKFIENLGFTAYPSQTGNGNIVGHYEYQEIKSDSLMHKEHHTDLAGNLLNDDEL